MRARAVSVTGCAAQADRWAGAEWARGAGCGVGSTGLRARRAGRAGPRERAGALAGGPKEMGARGVAWLGQLVRGKSGESRYLDAADLWGRPLGERKKGACARGCGGGVLCWQRARAGRLFRGLSGSRGRPSGSLGRAGRVLLWAAGERTSPRWAGVGRAAGKGKRELGLG
jgi:hypothetical protein